MTLGSQAEARILIKNVFASQPELSAFLRKISNVESFTTPILQRRVELKDREKLNRMVQSSCADMILVALEYLYKQNRVRVLPHFHDELVLQCLTCQEHTQEICNPIKTMKNLADL